MGSLHISVAIRTMSRDSFRVIFRRFSFSWIPQTSETAKPGTEEHELHKRL